MLPKLPWLCDSSRGHGLVRLESLGDQRSQPVLVEMGGAKVLDLKLAQGKQ